ncbi:MAG TPA: hypothetical protein VGJ19_23990 [Streptosporangiaceae bacterium]
MLMILVLVVAAAAALLALLAAGLKGLRDGDRPLDVTVRAAPSRAACTGAGHPEGAPRSVLAWVHNPGPVPVLVGLSVRRSHLPGWLVPGLNARVPLRTRQPRFGPGAQDTMGVVAPGESEGWPVAAPATGRRGRLVAVIGQAGGRLRVITLAVPLSPAGPAASQPAGTPARFPTSPGRAARPD